MKYAAVVFDLFGTLVNNYPYEPYRDVLRQVASILTVPFNDFWHLWSETARDRSLGIIRTIEDNIEYTCNKLGASIDSEKIEYATKIRYDFIANIMIPQQDVVEVLAHLKSHGLKIGLISNCSAETPIAWKNTPVAPLFDVALFSSSIGLRKPDPRIYQLALERLDVKPADCLYIGDGDSQELSGAGQVGMHPVLIRLAGEDGTQPHLINREEWKEPVISSLHEVLALVE
jgi:putative hydrolase of the HAD superfamily